ncbi:MAG: EAL domain-containing protein, partial [Candidatus Eisenbacteria bacterium]|nr:EAL domain-containing protein [Candidatus Eisenbacteria bacterium]
GFDRAAWWARFSARATAGGGTWVLECAYPPMDLVELTTMRGGRVVAVQRAGDAIPSREHPFPAPTYRFALAVDTSVATTYTIRMKTEGPIHASFRIWEARALADRDLRQHLYLGGYFGLMVVMVLYAVFFWLFSRELTYLYYIGYVVFHALFQSVYVGIAMRYFWPENAWWASTSLVVFASLGVAFSALFTREFLQRGRLIPRLRLLIDACLVLSLVTCVIAFIVPYAVSVLVANIMLVVFSGVYVIAGILTLRRGYAPARLYLIAWSVLLVAVFWVGMANFGLVPLSGFSANPLQIGSIVEVLLLSIAISDRINHLRRENVTAERELRLSRERELNATEERLYNDGLTGLPNRNRLIVDAPSFRSPTLFLINVDHFKGVNDFYGNKLGDRVLLELRSRIESRSSPRPHRLYRLHADEYALVLEGELPRSSCLDYGAELHAACTSEPYEIAGQRVRLDCSIGISQTAGALLEQADMALDEARNHSASVRIYDPSMETMRQYAANVRWVGVIRDALKADAVFPVFQPIRDNQTQAVSKFESLIRLRTEEGEVVAPRSFLGVAKAAKLYPELSRRVIRKSFAAFDGLDVEFSVNISIEDILQEETLEAIRECLRVYDVHGRVVFEILESEGIHRYDIASAFIEAVKAEGCKIAIDDFGSGYSNFEHILRLKVDYLKLDASLVRNLDGDRQAYAIVETIQRFAERLGLSTIAEHVHSAEIQRAVQALGVHFSQGYYIGEPGPLPRQ